MRFVLYNIITIILTLPGRRSTKIDQGINEIGYEYYITSVAWTLDTT